MKSTIDAWNKDFVIQKAHLASLNQQKTKKEDMQLKENLAKTEITKLEVIKMLFIPDFGEFALLFVSLGLTYLLAIFLEFPLYSTITPKFFGLVALAVYGYTWGYAGIGHYTARISRIREKLQTGDIVVDFKLFGFTVGTVFLIWGMRLG